LSRFGGSKLLNPSNSVAFFACFLQRLFGATLRPAPLLPGREGGEVVFAPLAFEWAEGPAVAQQLWGVQ